MQNNKLSTLAIIFAGVSVLFLPIAFGPAALILAIIAMTKKEPRATLALILSIALPVLGAILGAVAFTSMVNSMN